MNSEIKLKRHILEAIQSVKENIDNKPFRKVNVNDLANEAGIGRNLLQRGFKLLFGKSLKEYRLRKIMEIAKSMLEEDRLTIKQIAYKCGYRSQSNFTTSFRTVFNLTPTEYQYQDVEAL